MAKTEATIADLYMAGEDARAELVNGELVVMAPVGGAHGRIGSLILFALGRYEQETSSGYALMDNVGYVVNLPRRRSFSPDVSYTNGRIPLTEKFIDGAPVFAVEIRSPDDYGPKADEAYAAKRRDYFDAGAIVVWDVSPRERTIRSYRADRSGAPAEFRPGDLANAEPALPDWRVPVNDLFPPAP